MAQADWTELVNSLGSPSVARGVTHGITRPNGGGNFVYAFNSRVSDEGVVGLYASPTVGTDFAPMLKGGRICAAIQRGPSGGVVNFAPMLFFCLATNHTEGSGYLLGLSDEDPHRIVLRKGRPTEGIPAVTPGSSGVLRRSVATFSPGEYLHLRLDVICNPSGDVILSVKQSDLALHAVSAPSWVAIEGMDDFVDDAAGIASGSLPYVGGYAGFAFWTKDVARRAFFDHIEVAKQIAP